MREKAGAGHDWKNPVAQRRRVGGRVVNRPIPRKGAEHG